MTIILTGLLLLILAGLGWIAWQLGGPRKAEIAHWQERERELTNMLAAKAAENEELKIEKATRDADLNNERKNAAEQLKRVQEMEEHLKVEFENLANRIFDSKGRHFGEQNKEHLTALLQPFKEQLESFRNRINDVHKDNTAWSAQLIEQVRQVQALSNQVGIEANNLARAIKGEAKQQGTWGELIVERVIEAAGLEEGRDFIRQPTEHTEDGKWKRPDFMVHLPDDKMVIIDSKVSIVAYERYCNTTDQAERARALKEHVASVRRHIEELCAKDYGAQLGNRALDFVIMCIPLESAYQIALQEDDKLLYDLAKTKVVLSGPATLMITLKVIAQIWRRENENRHAEEIARQAGGIYDQVALVAEAMEEAQRKLKSTTEAFDKVQARLCVGRGNLIGRVENIRALGANTKKIMPAAALKLAGMTEPEEAT